MGKRLSKIYTRKGDTGQTGLGDGARVGKDHPRIQAIGAIDELNCTLGMLIEDLRDIPGTEDESLLTFLCSSQHRLFDLGGALSIPGSETLAAHHVTEIETQLDELNAHLAPLEDFVLPGGSRPIASAHFARAVCRRAERCLVELARQENVGNHAIEFLNRFSDYLFVVARTCARLTSVDEVLWRND